MYELRDSPGKGKGLFASAAGIRQGDCIIAEAPILTVDLARFRLPPAELELHLEEKLQSLEDDQRAEFMSLSTNGANENHPLSSRFLTNALGTDEDDDDRQEQQKQQQQQQQGRRQPYYNAVPAVFRNASRLNHSCVPNCHFSWDRTARTCLVHAITDVSPGDELTVAYDSRGTAQTKADMETTMGFRCACPRCTLPPEEVSRSDERRRELNAILAEVDLAYRAADPRDQSRDEDEGKEEREEDRNGRQQWDIQSPRSSFAPERILPLCRRIVALQQLEFGSAPAIMTYELGLAMHYASSSCFLHDDYVRASAFASRALAAFTVCEGADGQNARAYRDLTRDLASTIRSKKPLAGNQQAYDRWLWLPE
ncbi:hypothetical protein MCOR25_009783 [Pyricularia grisea]|uniref:SET domain-containing protein n=1 Tax=Pyricularia grisea TaxID=148305 RepID=A0A6P8AY58_PYRGI|nr:hypothetical protein PgNI_10426 [Pyricularia grisea]KAI6351704.1 hypothetical protein MCOR25_009783 [Pyricularia grisea]TLD07270.1 hypothetical protein PgNI_10426 [Pyricularia grisea]